MHASIDSFCSSSSPLRHVRFAFATWSILEHYQVLVDSKMRTIRARRTTILILFFVRHRLSGSFVGIATCLSDVDTSQRTAEEQVEWEALAFGYLTSIAHILTTSSLFLKDSIQSLNLRPKLYNILSGKVDGRYCSSSLSPGWKCCVCIIKYHAAVVVMNE